MLKSIILLLFTVLLTTESFSQVNWSKLYGPYGSSINDIYSNSKNEIFALTSKGTYKSNSIDDAWQNISSNLNNNRFFEIAGDEDVIYIGGSGKVYRSQDNGTTWENVGIEGESLEVVALACYENIVIAITGVWNANFYYSHNRGETWNKYDINVTTEISDVVILDSTSLFMVSKGDGIFRSIDQGENWAEVNGTLQYPRYSEICIMDSSLLLGVNNDIYYSNNYGEEWTLFKSDIADSYISTIIVDHARNIIVGTYGGEIYYSPDVGNTWNRLDSDFNNEEITCITSTIDNSIFVGTSPTGIIVSHDFGSSWAYKNQNISSYFCTSLLIDSLDNIYYGSYEGIMRYNSNDSLWGFLNDGLEKLMYSYEIIGLAQTIDGKLYAASHNGIYQLDQNNNYWNFRGVLECSSILITDSSHIIVSTYRHGMYRSIDHGENWNNVYTHDNSSYTDIRGITQNSMGHLFASSDKGILKSADHGKTWKIINDELTLAGGRSLTCSSNDILYIGIYGRGVYKSIDSGISWTTVNDGFSNTNITSLISNSSGQTFMSIWGNQGGVYKIDDGESIWERESNGLTNSNINVLTFDSNEYLYAGTRDGELFISDAPLTSVAQSSNSIVNQFTLHQNYPNPYNPKTVISYSISKPEFILLEIYNLQGELIQILENKKKILGNYINVFDGSKLSSGIYFYKLTMNNYSQTKKMILLK